MKKCTYDSGYPDVCLRIQDKGCDGCFWYSEARPIVSEVDNVC